MRHKITVKFKCGHEFKFRRELGGVTSPGSETCACEVCQPWDGKVDKDQGCVHCLLDKTNGFSVPTNIWWRVCDVVPA